MSDSRMEQVDYKAFRFGEFEFSRRAGLLRAGERIALPPKEHGLLELLLSRRGKIATHLEIEAALWPEEGVSYASLARCVHSLRKILQDNERSIIVTVPKRGYAMGVPVASFVNGHALGVTEKSVHTETRAYSEFIEGVCEANRSDPDSQQRAIELFETAHSIDPSYAVPLAAIAECRIYQAIRGYEMPVDALRAGLDACARALSVDDRLASAYAARGWFEGVMQRNPEAGLSSLDYALSIDPNYARAHAFRAWVQRGEGELAASLSSAQRAVELDPHSILNRHLLAWSHFINGDVDEALAIERVECQERPNVDVAHAYVAVMSAWSGLHDEAVAAAREAARVSRGNPAIETALSYVDACTGETGRARELAAELAAQELPRAQRSHLAMTYVALRDFDTALEMLTEARGEHCPWFPGARYDLRLGPLAGDPRLNRLYA